MLLKDEDVSTFINVGILKETLSYSRRITLRSWSHSGLVGLDSLQQLVGEERVIFF